MQAPLQDWMVAWAGDFELDPSSREGLSGPNTNQIWTVRSVRRRQTLKMVVSLLQRRACENHANFVVVVGCINIKLPSDFVRLLARTLSSASNTDAHWHAPQTVSVALT
jgi:hypothetical protein